MRIPRALGKRRTREHVIADLGVNFVERQVLLCGYTAERVRYDYGYDLMLFTYNARGEAERGCAFLQVKATDHLRVLPKQQAIAFRVEHAHLRLWLNEKDPVFFVVYDAQADVAYWVDTRNCPALKGIRFLLKAAGITTIHLPLANRLDPTAIRKMGKVKNKRRRYA
jgi:hypothetical protein